MLGSLILYLKGMRICMFQLSGFYCNENSTRRTAEGMEDGGESQFEILLYTGSASPNKPQK